MTQPRILVLDIETSPHIVYTWGLHQQNIGLSQIIEPTRMLSWSAKWHGDKGTVYGSEWSHNGWVEDLRDLILDADAICHYNGTTFDYPHIRREVRLAGLGSMPDKIKQIDLLKTVRKFRLASSKLDWAAYTFIGEQKVAHDGFPLWRRVLAGDVPSRELFEKYNRGDVDLTDRMLTELKPDIGSQLNMALFSGDTIACTKCMSPHLMRRGFAYADTGRYQRYQCKDCGGWTQDTHRDLSVAVRGA